MMRSLKIYSSLFWLLFAVVMGHRASLLPMGEMRETGAGFFPLAIALVTGFLAILALLQALRRKKDLPEEAPDAPERFRWWNIAVILAALVAYGLTLEKVGFLVNTFLFMLLLIKVIEPQSWTKSLLAALITAVVAELFFNVLLSAQIPKGILGF
jgi:putative tricarboxylic transport membrane protein